HQALRPDRADLFFGEIDHCHDLAADQILRVVVLGDLRAGFAHADFRAKIDMQHMSGIAGLGKGLRVEHFADAQLHLFKVGPFDRLHGSGLVPGSTRRMIRRYAAPCDTASSIWFMRCTKRAGSSSSPPSASTACSNSSWAKSSKRSSACSASSRSTSGWPGLISRCGFMLGMFWA